MASPGHACGQRRVVEFHAHLHFVHAACQGVSLFGLGIYRGFVVK